MICCDKVLSSVQSMPVIDKCSVTKCLQTAKQAAVLALSLFAVFASGSLSILSAAVLFSGAAAVLPYLLILTTALLGFVCAVIVLLRNLSAVVQSCKKRSPEEIEGAARPSDQQESGGRLSEESASPQASPTSSTFGLESALRSIGDSVSGAFDDINKDNSRSRSHSF
ncbi:inclusion membrane protein IncG [Chlamydia trachomatis]|uniref:inclusion membrane protein IncG n=1 Tax=Chlamydia trachomatis TaxID=813 RepID=UPI0001A350EC|nr:inclusion membrane protein IncG [Chlamydia trachomatis]CAX09671.1 inclusion membrane protein G [Chlamydia trachomatis B/TZ1A828/OT]